MQITYAKMPQYASLSLTMRLMYTNFANLW